jgi:hypothetical protein
VAPRSGRWGLDVVVALALAIVNMEDGAWIQSTVWVFAGVGFGCTHGITLLRQRRA